MKPGPQPIELNINNKKRFTKDQKFCSHIKTQIKKGKNHKGERKKGFKEVGESQCQDAQRSKVILDRYYQPNQKDQASTSKEQKRSEITREKLEAKNISKNFA